MDLREPAVLTPDLVKQGARDVGQVTDFDAKYASTLESVKSDIALGKQLGVAATPTFFINGKKIDGALPPAIFQQAIAYELRTRNSGDRRPRRSPSLELRAISSTRCRALDVRADQGLRRRVLA